MALLNSGDRTKEHTSVAKAPKYVSHSGRASTKSKSIGLDSTASVASSNSSSLSSLVAVCLGVGGDVEEHPSWLMTSLDVSKFRVIIALPIIMLRSRGCGAQAKVLPLHILHTCNYAGVALHLQFMLYSVQHAYMDALGALKLKLTT